MEQIDRLAPTGNAGEQLREQMRSLIADLGKQATLTLADLYATEDLRIEVSHTNREPIATERDAFTRNIGQASALLASGRNPTDRDRARYRISTEPA